MNFTLFRGKDFTEHFDFKNAKGESIALPHGVFSIILEHGGFAREYTVLNDGLSRLRNRINWTIDGSESQDFEFNTYYYTLYLDGNEVTRGVLRIQ